MRCIQQTHTEDLKFVIQLISPSSPSMEFHVCSSGDSEAKASVVAGVRVGFSEIADDTLLEWIPVDNRVCSMRLRGTCKVDGRHFARCNLFLSLRTRQRTTTQM